MTFEEAYAKHVEFGPSVVTITELERILIAEFRQDKSPLMKRIANACGKLLNVYKTNEFPEGDSRRLRNLVCYNRLNDKVREFGK